MWSKTVKPEKRVSKDRDGTYSDGKWQTSTGDVVDDEEDLRGGGLQWGRNIHDINWMS